MDVRQLSVFIAVAEERSFTRASTRLHTVQSAISATIQSLEAELAAELFDRSARQIELTNAGAALLPRARTVMDALAEARDSVDAVEGGVTGSVAVGFLTSITIVDIPALLGEFVARYPGVRVSLRASERGSAGLADLLVSGELDIAFIAESATARSDLTIEPLGSSPLVLTVPAGHRLAGRTSVDVSEIDQEDFVDFPTGFANRSLVDQLFAAEGRSREVRLETADVADAAALVRHGLGISFLPENLVDSMPDLATVSIVDHDLRLVMSVAVAKERRVGRAAQHLWDLAVAGQQMGGAGPRGRAAREPVD